MVGLHDLKGLFQSKRKTKFMILYCKKKKKILMVLRHEESIRPEGITHLQLQLEVVRGASSPISQLCHPNPEERQAMTFQEGLEAGLGVRVLDQAKWEWSQTQKKNPFMPTGIWLRAQLGFW